MLSKFERIVDSETNREDVHKPRFRQYSDHDHGLKPEPSYFVENVDERKPDECLEVELYLKTTFMKKMP